MKVAQQFIAGGNGEKDENVPIRDDRTFVTRCSTLSSRSGPVTLSYREPSTEVLGYFHCVPPGQVSLNLY
jgi:hypothetical protein